MNALIKHQTNTQIQSFSDEEKNLIKKTVADKATDLELQMFLHLATKYQLDPFAKEIWFIKYKDGDKPQIFTSRDGYLKIAHASGVFNGMESFTVDDEKGNPIKAVCKVYRKDMERPFSAEIKVSEYRQNSPTWSKFPSAMAIKVAEVFALKRAFTINGLATSEELPQEASPVNQAVLIQPQAEPEDWNQNENVVNIQEVLDEVERPQVINDKQRVLFCTTAGKNGWIESAQKELLDFHGITSRSLIPVGIFQSLLDAVSVPYKAEVTNNG